jgi:hypothetical protein
MKTTFRRLQQLEQRHSESLAANDASGARERILERLKGMADRLSSDPNWREPTELDVEVIKQRMKAFFATRANGV